MLRQKIKSELRRAQHNIHSKATKLNQKKLSSLNAKKDSPMSRLSFLLVVTNYANRFNFVSEMRALSNLGLSLTRQARYCRGD